MGNPEQLSERTSLVFRLLLAAWIGFFSGALHAQAARDPEWESSGVSVIIWVFFYLLPLGLLARPFLRGGEAAWLSLIGCVAHLATQASAVYSTFSRASIVTFAGFVTGLLIIWTVGLFVIRIASRLRRTFFPPSGLCRKCGYDLRASPGPQCPECGECFGNSRS